MAKKSWNFDRNLKINALTKKEHSKTTEKPAKIQTDQLHMAFFWAYTVELFRWTGYKMAVYPKFEILKLPWVFWKIHVLLLNFKRKSCHPYWNKITNPLPSPPWIATFFNHDCEILFEIWTSFHHPILTPIEGSKDVRDKRRGIVFSLCQTEKFQYKPKREYWRKDYDTVNAAASLGNYSSSCRKTAILITLCYRIAMSPRLFILQENPSAMPLFDPSRLLIFMSNNLRKNFHFCALTLLFLKLIT